LTPAETEAAAAAAASSLHTLQHYLVLTL